MEDQDCYEFVKFFIQGAKTELLNLKDPTPTAKLVQSGANVVPQSLGYLGMGIKAGAFMWNLVDEILQGNKKRVSDAVVDSTAESSKDREEIFIRMFIPPALEIYHSCKNQLKLVRRGKTKESVSDNASQRKAIEILASFLGAQCFELMIQKQNKDNLDKILIKLRRTSFQNVKSWVKSKKDQTTEDNLYMKSDSKEKIYLSKYKFFSRLIPAFSSDMNLSSSARKKDKVQLYVNKADKNSCTRQSIQSNPLFLRGPTHSDNFPTGVPTPNFAPVSVPTHFISHFEAFTQLNKLSDETVQNVYDQLMEDLSFDRKMAKWALLQNMHQTFVENKGLLSELKQIVQEIPEKTREVLKSTIQELLPLSTQGSCANKIFPCPYESECRPEAPSFLFVGRAHLIAEVQARFASREKQSPREHIIVIAGLQGMGKSEFCRQFARENLATQIYDAVFWIEAESFNDLRQCFISLAMYFKLPPFSPGNAFELNQQLAESITSVKAVKKLTQTIYAHLSSQNKKTLFIFDNADNTENFDKPDPDDSKKTNSNVSSSVNPQKFSTTSNFVPQQILAVQPHVLITSTLKSKELWPSGSTVLDMPVFSLEDTSDYFKKKFDIPKNERKYDEDIKKLHLLILRGFPLATAIAFAYIRKVGRSDICQGIRKYMELFDSEDWINTEGDSDVTYDKVMRNVWKKLFKQLEILCPRALNLLYTIILSDCRDNFMLQSVANLLETNGRSEIGQEETREALGYLEDFCLVTRKTSYLTQFMTTDYAPYPSVRMIFFVRHFYPLDKANDNEMWKRRRTKLNVHDLVQKVVLEGLKNDKGNKGEEKFLHVARVMRDIIRDRRTDLQMSDHLHFIIFNLLEPLMIGKHEPFFRRNMTFILSVILADPLYLQLCSTAFALVQFQKLVQHVLVVRGISTQNKESSNENGNENWNWNEIERDLVANQIYFLYHSLLNQIETEKLGETEGRENCPLKNKDFVPEGDELRNISCQDALTWIWKQILKYQEQSDNVVEMGIKYLCFSDQLDILLRDSEMNDTAIKWVLTYGKREWHILFHFFLRSLSHSLDSGLHNHYGDLIELYLSQLNRELENTGLLSYGLLRITENLTEDKKLGEIFRLQLAKIQAQSVPILGNLLRRSTSGEERNGEHEKNGLHTFCILKNTLVKYEDRRDLTLASSSITKYLQSFLKNWLRLPQFDEQPFIYPISLFKILRAYFGLLMDLSTSSLFPVKFLTENFFNSVQCALHKFQENVTWMNPYKFPTLWMMLVILPPGFNHCHLDVMCGELKTLVQEYSDDHYKYILDFYDELEKEQNGNQSDLWTKRLEEVIQDMGSLEFPTPATDLVSQLAGIILKAISEPRRPVQTPQAPTNGQNDIQMAIAIPFGSLLEDTEHVRGLHTFFYRHGT